MQIVKQKHTCVRNIHIHDFFLLNKKRLWRSTCYAQYGQCEWRMCLGFFHFEKTVIEKLNWKRNRKRKHCSPDIYMPTRSSEMWKMAFTAILLRWVRIWRSSGVSNNLLCNNIYDWWLPSICLVSLNNQKKRRFLMDVFSYNGSVPVSHFHQTIYFFSFVKIKLKRL